MIQLKVTCQEADGLLDSIAHSTFQSARKKYWIVSHDGYIRAQSIYWFFCWAKTGMKSEPTAQACRTIFDEIFPFTFSDFDARVPHEFARFYRYSTETLENALKAYLLD
jgi:formyltetrahydrofolate hydrolase